MVRTATGVKRPIKVYVAGKWEDRERVREVMRILKEDNFEITCDWTTHEYPPVGEEYKLAFYAIQDIEGVLKAEALLIMAEKEYNYRGALVEMGVALGKRIPIYVVGHGLDGCIFLEMPQVWRCDTLDKAILYLERLDMGTD